MDKVTSILLTGVGGQGTILVSRILTQGLIRAGYDVKMSEVHGMAQRGGSVSTQVRFGRKVYSPIIGRGEADIMVAFEKMEAVRYAEFLKPGATVIVNDYEIMPMTVASGLAEYPEGAIEAVKAGFRTVAVKAGGHSRGAWQRSLHEHRAAGGDGKGPRYDGYRLGERDENTAEAGRIGA